MDYNAVVIIDNDAKFRKTLVDIIRLKGYQTTEIDSGLEGMQYIRQEKPAVALIDIRMDDISGLEIIRKIKSESIPTECIVLTGYSSHASAIEAVNIGAYQYLQKPFNMEQLLLTIHRATEKRRAEDDLVLSMERYRDLIENAQEGIFQFARDGRCIMANRAMASIISYDTPMEVLSRVQGGLIEILEDSPDTAIFLDILEREGVVKNFEVKTRPTNGHSKWLSIYARKVTNRQGHFLYYEGIAEDITSRKKTEENLTNTMAKLRRAMEGVIQAMAMAVETRDPYTAGHQKRVANLARAIAQEMGIDMMVTDGIRMAAAIHDIGKIAVPAEILSKPTKLTDLEYSLIKIHSTAGYDILKEIDFPWPIAEIVLQHHEKINGSGYPAGLKGEEIRIEARIICVADVVEAIGSHRPYRPTLGIDRALEEISVHRGTLFDEDVVQTCLDLFQQHGFRLE